MDELQNDLNEVAELEPQPRRGRPHGNTLNAAKRAATRERVRAFREKQRELKLAEAEDCERRDQFFKRMRQEGFTLFGELEAVGPDGHPVNASNAAEELQLAKEYAAALNLDDIRPGQTIRNFVTEVLRAWCSAGAKLFNRTTRQFSNKEVEGLKPDEYNFPDGVDETPILEVTNV